MNRLHFISLKMDILQAAFAFLLACCCLSPRLAAGKTIADIAGENKTTETEKLQTGYLPHTVLEGSIDPDDYVLGPSDELVLILRGAKKEIINLRVLPEGKIIVPNLGPFKVSGLTLSEFKMSLKKSLSHFYKNIEIDCQLSRPRTFMIYMLGEVNAPGPVELFAPFRVSLALKKAGGVKKTGSLRKIEIRRGNSVVRTVDMLSFLRLGIESENARLKEGQTVYVPARDDLVEVIGEVKIAGIYELLIGETVEDLIRICGGLGSTADTNNIVLERFGADDHLESNIMKLGECAQNKLQDRDKIIVPDRMSYPGVDFVRLSGGGGRDGIFHISSGERIGGFLRRVGRFREGFDLDRAVIERKLPGGRQEYIRLNIEKILAGDPAGELELKNKDVITIPPIELKVYVGGEVKDPGEVPYYPGFTAARYIGLAGGLTEAGSLGKMDIYSVNGKKRKGRGNSAVFGGETILVKKRTSKILGSAFVSLTSITGLVISIIALTR